MFLELIFKVSILIWIEAYLMDKSKYNKLSKVVEQVLEDLYYKAKDDSDVIDCDWFTNPKVPAPEGWEGNLREKLKKELPDGCYDMSTKRMTLFTGKGGRIEMEVALQKALKGYL